jgi:MFS transporter, FHS family, L-fucose permease
LLPPTISRPEVTNANTRYAEVLITSLFFMWGFALNLNPILIPHLKKACQLNDLQSAMIDSASYVAYFVMAVPAGLFMKRKGYKGGIILGLILFAVGAFLFFPAAEMRTYFFFLFALFVIACGLTFLETAANPYIMVVGNPETATRRLNLAQSFNGLAATLAPLAGGYFILSGSSLSPADESAMSTAQLTDYLNMEASAVKVPFLIIGLVVLVVAFLLWKASLPEIVEEDEAGKVRGSLWKEKNLMLGVMTQFFYVGGQVCVSSFFIRFSGYVAGIAEQSAAYILSGALFGFMAGRFIGTFLMKFISPPLLLAIYSVIIFCLIILSVLLHGAMSVYALAAAEFFMSIMFPTIFSLSIRGLGSKTKEGSSLVIMSIVGGAVFPLIMGWISDVSNIQLAYLLPAFCMGVVFYFAFRNINVKGVVIGASH